MARVLVIKDPQSLACLLKPQAVITGVKVALVLLKQTGRPGRDCDQSSVSTSITDGAGCTIYQEINRQSQLEWVPARLQVIDGGKTYIREDAACSNSCTQAMPRAPTASESRFDGTLDAQVMRCADIELNPVTHRVMRRGRPLHVAATEFKVLQILLERPERVFSRRELIEAVWGESSTIDERTVDVHIGRLRKVLNSVRGQDLLRTVRGAGYALVCDRLPARTTKGSLSDLD